MTDDPNARIGNLQDFIPHDDLEYIFGETEYPTDPFEMSRASKDETQNRFGISLLDLCCMYNIHVLNGRLFEDVKGEITCVANAGRSVVDYMVASTSLFDSFTYFKVGCEDFSDHFPLICRINLSCPGQGIQKTNFNMNGNAWRKFKWKENLKDQFIYSFTTLFAELKTKISRANEPIVNFLPEFINIYINACKNMACVNRQQKRRRDQPPWWDADCQSAKAEKYSSLKQFRRTNHQCDFEHYKRAKSRFKALCKSKRLHCEKQKRSELSNACKNPKEYWRLIKQNCNKNSNPENQIAPEQWIDYFENLLNTNAESENDTLLQEIVQNHDASDLDSPITDDEIISSIKSMNPGKSPGPDGIVIEMFKSTLGQILPFLKTLFNDVYDRGEVPADWCESIICPIFKSGSNREPQNYRGISLMNSISKIFNGILTARVQKWAEENNVLDESQAGFRRGFSTIGNIFSLHAMIQKYICRSRGRFYCLFVDFKRAFDSIQHEKMWDSLKRKGIPENSKFLKVFQSMYKQLKSCVKIENSLSEFFRCTIGTMQGCISSPIIFCLFINDLVAYLRTECNNRGIFITNDIEDILALMFADDVSCFSDTVIRLQKMVDLIGKFCKSVGMEINLKKTKIMVFRNGGIVKQTEKWLYQGTEIEIVSIYKYLGLYFTPKLIWSKSNELLAMQAKKAISSILRYQKHFGYFQPVDAFKLFDTMVKPIACYGSEIWGYKFSEKTEKVQTKFCKYYTGLKQNTNDSFALGECGRFPMAIFYMTQVIKYWLKLTQMPNNRYPRQCYLMLKSLTDNGKVTWTTHVKSLLFQNGFGHAWMADGVGNVPNFLNIFTRRLKDISLQNWHSQINDSPKGLHYKHFKSQLDVEKYLSIDLSYICRKTLANFRCSSHNLAIEKGRHTNVEREYRFCQFCLQRNVYVVEDEFHFFLLCPMYDTLRNMYFKPQWKANISVQKFYIIMQLSDARSLLLISKFLVSAFEFRKSIYGSDRLEPV